MSEVFDLVEPLVRATEERLTAARARPRATYRLQFHRDQLTFREAAEIVPYLRELGISHVYSSPYLKARPGSEHGYDIVDHGRLNPDLGSEADYRAFTAAIRAAGLGQILDIVPNHMGVGSEENAWWHDVLENGPSSPYAHYFDIDWHPAEPELQNKILLPTLGEQYGQVLEAGQLKLEYRGGEFVIRCYETALPLDPKTYAPILRHRLDELKETLGPDSEPLYELESIVTALEYLPDATDTDPARVEERQREKEVIKGRLRRLVDESSAVAEFIQNNVRELGGDPANPRSFDRLDDLLNAQVYRLAHWKAASDEINYRRFFDINDLAALCMEEPDVFGEAHRLVFDLLARGELDGLRIDHIDGLYDPTEYLWRLQWGYLQALGQDALQRQLEAERGEDGGGMRDEGGSRTGAHVGLWDELEPHFFSQLHSRLGGPPPESVLRHSGRVPTHEVEGSGDPVNPRSSPESQEAGNGPVSGSPLRALRTPLSARIVDPEQLPLYVLVEKILEADEPLPAHWPVAGTTGYDFLNLTNGLFVDESGLREVVKTYTRFINKRLEFGEVEYESKRLILRVAMSSELQMLAYRLNRLSEQHRRTRDFTLNDLRTALREILACFPVYRTYIAGEQITDRDRHFVQLAVARAKRRNPAMDAALFNFVRDTLLLEQPPDLDEKGCRERLVFVGRFQQVSSPVMAKGIEDTAFYRYFPLCSLNEVGGAPAEGTTSVQKFHQDNHARLAQRPRSLIGTTTHDAKRSQDVRARINVLAEIPHYWRKAVSRWSRLNRRHRRELHGEPAPSRNDEYLLYQTLVGVWPLTPPDAAGGLQLVSRLQGYMEKATHEAKERTSWINPDADYDAAVRDFVAAVLEDSPRNRFLADFREFHESIVNWGLYTALSQTLLKLTAPGVPDIYQGQELWDFSLVDPDNRRPVDFARHRDLLSGLKRDLQTEQEEAKTQADPLASDADRKRSAWASDLSPSSLQLARHLAHTPRDPRLKLLVTWKALELRRESPDLFCYGDYLPLPVEGERARHVCAFLRRWAASPDGAAERIAVVVVPRLLAQLTPWPEDGDHRPPPPLGPQAWQDTQIVCDEPLPDELTNLFTGQRLAPDGNTLPLAGVLADFPVAVLV